MSDNIFSAVLTFSLLAAGTAAVGSEMLAPRHTAPATALRCVAPVDPALRGAPLAAYRQRPDQEKRV